MCSLCTWKLLLGVGAGFCVLYAVCVWHVCYSPRRHLLWCLHVLCCWQLLVGIWMGVTLQLLVRVWTVLHCAGGHLLGGVCSLHSRELLVGLGTGVSVLHVVSCGFLRHRPCRYVVCCLYSLCSWELCEWVRNAVVMRLVLVWTVLDCAGGLLLSGLCAVRSWKLLLGVGADVSVLVAM